MDINAPNLAKPTSTREPTIGFLLVVLVLLLLPLERITFPLSLKVVDVVFLVLLGFVGLTFLRSNRKIQVPLAFPGLLIITASLFSTLVAPTNTDSIIAIVQELYIFTWFVALTNILISFKPSQFDLLLKIWSIVAIIEAVTSLMGMLKIGPAMFYTSPIKDNVLDTGAFNRGFGTFANPNSTGAYLAISFFIILATDWPKSLRTILGIFMFAGIYSTGSMGAVLSTTIGFALLTIIKMVLKNRQIVFLFGGVLAIGIAILLMMFFVFNSGPSLSQITSAGKENQFLALTLGRLTHSVSGRAILVGDAWQVFERYPLGTGPNTADAHNDYIAFLLDRGPLGFLGWLWLIVITLITPIRNLAQYTDQSRRWQILTIWAGFIAILVEAFAHEISHFRQVWVLIAFLYAAYYLFSGMNNPSFHRYQHPSRFQTKIK